jgi:hypothetical protein
MFSVSFIGKRIFPERTGVKIGINGKEIPIFGWREITG